MDASTLQRLDPEFTRRRDIAEHEAMCCINGVSAGVNAEAERTGLDIAEDPENKDALEEIRLMLGLQPGEPLISARLLPPHDSFESGVHKVASRFLVVESRHPNFVLPGAAGQDHLRAYFLILGNEVTAIRPYDIFPFYAVSEVDTRSGSGSQWRTHVLHAVTEDLPTGHRPAPQPAVISAYEEVLAEMRKAIESYNSVG